MANWYCSSAKWSAVTAWAAGTAYAVGALRRQSATPAVNSERVFRCTTAGTSGGAEPSWNLTKGATTTDNTVVWTEVTGNSTYGWSAPFARIHAALGWMAAGDTLYVGNNHSSQPSSTATHTYASPGTAASPCYILCVNESAAPPTAMATGAVEGQISSTSQTTFFTGFALVYGVTFTGETTLSSGNFTFNINSTNPWHWRIESGGLSIKLPVGTTSNASGMTFGPNNINTDDQLFELINSNITYTNPSGGVIRITPRTRFNWRGGALVGDAPTALFGFGATGNPGIAKISGVDLSAVDSGKALVEATIISMIEFERCKLGSGVSLTTGSNAGPGGARVSLVNCDSASTSYRYQSHSFMGDEYSETTIIRTGGASDGTTPISRKLTSSNYSHYLLPLESAWMLLWNSIVGSTITITVPIITETNSLTDDEIWLEVDYMGLSGSPQSVYATTRKTNYLAAASVHPTDSDSVWNDSSFGSPVKQKLSVSFTPQIAGLLRARVVLAKPITTVYYDPKLIKG